MIARSVLLLAVAACLAPALPSTAQAQSNVSYCVSGNTVPHFESFSLVWNEIKSICGETLSVFYCFTSYSTNEQEICGNGGVLIGLQGYGSARIGLAPYDVARNELVIGACPYPAQPWYDGMFWQC